MDPPAQRSRARRAARPRGVDGLSGYDTTGPLASRIAIHAYGTNPVPWYDFVRALLPPADRVLDAGAGTGALWAGAPPDGLVAVDASPAMCATLRSVVPSVVRASVDRLPFADASFGGAVCNHVLYHVASPLAGLAELRRVVRPGGWVAVATNGTGHMREASDLSVALGLPATDVHEHFPAETAATAVGAFFDDVRVYRYDDELLVPSAVPVAAYIASLAGRALTADEEAYVARAVGDGPFRIGKHTVLVTGRRAEP